MKPGHAEYDAFKELLNRITSVPHSEIVRREAEYKRKAALNPRKRGPKTTQKPVSPVHDPDPSS